VDAQATGHVATLGDEFTGEFTVEAVSVTTAGTLAERGHPSAGGPGYTRPAFEHHDPSRHLLHHAKLALVRSPRGLPRHRHHALNRGGVLGIGLEEGRNDGQSAIGVSERLGVFPRAEDRHGNADLSSNRAIHLDHGLGVTDVTNSGRIESPPVDVAGTAGHRRGDCHGIVLFLHVLPHALGERKAFPEARPVPIGERLDEVGRPTARRFHRDAAENESIDPFW
jgi:hypothetical protein